MNILFLTLLDFNSISEHGIYTDLLREFKKHGHFIYVISPIERKNSKKQKFVKEEGVNILKPLIGNIQKTNLIEKGISTITLETIFVLAIKKYFYDVHFDLIIYSTPPITFQKAVAYVKKRDNASTYLLLKDIFPQNAIDLGVLSKNGIKALLYYYFRKKEKNLYALSDYIGCMSEANVNYILKNNSEINPDIVEVCPNSIEVIDMRIMQSEKEIIRKKYGLPLNNKVFIYGGNLGKPQGIPFLIQCLKSQLKNLNFFFLIIGDGTEFGIIESFFQTYNPINMRLLKKLPQRDYEYIVSACDIGMIFLDHRFTIPNFPSRILSYMQAGIPVLAVTDTNTDIGKIAVEENWGWWCESNDIESFEKCIKKIMLDNIDVMGSRAYQYLNENYNIKNSYQVIMQHQIRKINQ